VGGGEAKGPGGTGGVEVAALRLDYRLAILDESNLAPDPIVQFERWLADAVAAEVAEPNAMVLATAGADGEPTARSVLLKGVDTRGFSFYTNRGSRKGVELAANPRAALVFPWYDIQRQVKVTGPVETVADDESDAYFASRPRGSQIGAWASRQSSVVPDRATIDRLAEEAEARFAGAAVPRPPYWGGYRVVPLSVEFWQGRPSRLHDRLRYRRDRPGGSWVVERLSP